MTRVVVDASILGWPDSGIRRYVDVLVTHLSRDRRLELVLVTNERDPVADVPGATEVARRVKSGMLWRNSAFALQARQADVVWSPWPMVPLWGVGRPLVVTVHDISPLLHRGTKTLTSTLGMATGGRRAVRAAAHVLCDSQTTAGDLDRHFGVAREKMTVVPLAVDPRFSPGDRDQARAGVKERWGLEGPFLLAVGTVEPRKGYDLLPKIACLLPELPIVVAGRPGPRSDELLAELAQACQVLGGVTDQELLDLYRAAEVLLVPSVYEGFGFTPWEAMACGTPALVAAGSGALEEMVRGVMPVLERDALVWANEIKAAASDRARLTAIGLRAASRRTWDDVASETAEVLLGVAPGGLPRRWSAP
jgi:O-antigen biosynthesis alpha-1,3-rhamnosyltransferase